MLNSKLIAHAIVALLSIQPSGHKGHDSIRAMAEQHYPENAMIGTRTPSPSYQQFQGNGYWAWQGPSQNGLLKEEEDEEEEGVVVVKEPQTEYPVEIDIPLVVVEHEQGAIEEHKQQSDAAIRGMKRVVDWIGKAIGTGVDRAIDYVAAKELEIEAKERAQKEGLTPQPNHGMSDDLDFRQRYASPPAAAVPSEGAGHRAEAQGAANEVNGALENPKVIAAPDPLVDAAKLPAAHPSQKKAAPARSTDQVKAVGRQRIPFVSEAYIESMEKIARERVAHMWGLDIKAAPAPPEQKLVQRIPPPPTRTVMKSTPKKVASRQVGKSVELHHGQDESDKHFLGTAPSGTEPPLPSAAPRPEVERDAGIGTNKAEAPAAPIRTTLPTSGVSI